MPTKSQSRSYRLPNLRIIYLRLLLAVTLSVGCGAFAINAGAIEAKSSGERFIRVLRSESGKPLALQTAIVTYRGVETSKVSVDLVVAVHIGEESYFQELNRAFEEYDSLLYELVARTEDVALALQNQEPNPLSSVQRGLTDALGLRFQLDMIDYRKRNFVHADLSPEEFGESMKKRGESATSMLVRFFAAALEQQKKSDPRESLAALSALLEKDPKQKSLKLKRIMAAQTEDMEGLIKSINGDDGSTLITGRNARALEVLRKRIKQGDKRLAIYYGAAHMDDIEQRLESEFKMKLNRTRWIDAWNLRESSVSDEGVVK